ncbi:hypothetical protein OG381_39330 [Streptomyces sp. NBC_00490]|uniref:hypothetical protein n=1 Tax=Streptomyces sp. NBC_00490 TaxID=2903657 RepID=UPI002E19A9B5
MGSAPNLTAVPDLDAKKLKWYQHFDIETSSRALVKYAKAELDVDDDAPALPAEPKVPAFPGRKYFVPGASNKYVLQLGKQARTLSWSASPHVLLGPTL